MEHYRIVISIDHIKSADEQPELWSVSLPGFRSIERCRAFALQIVKIALLLRNPQSRVDRERIEI